jgi:glutamate/aspartate transport system permease protein
MNYHWNWGIFLEQVKAGDETYLDWLAPAWAGRWRCR